MVGVLAIFIFVKVGLALSAHGIQRVKNPEEFKEAILKTILSGQKDFQVVVEQYTREEYDIAKILDEITMLFPETSVVFKGAINGSVKGYRNQPERMVEYTFLYRDLEDLDMLSEVPILDSPEAFKEIIKKAFERHQENLLVKIKSYQQENYPIGSIIEAFVNEYPILGTGYKGVESTIYGEGNDVILRMKLRFHFDKGAREKMIVASYEKVEAVVRDLIKPDMRAYEKLLKLHNYVVEQARYDIQNYRLNQIPPKSRTVYGIMIDGLGVCEGYANALKALLDEAGVENHIIVGTAGGDAHAWNLVLVEGDYYHVDSTWDDPITSSGKQILRHDYYALNDLEMSKTHHWKVDDYPKATSTRYAYKKTQEAVAKDEQVRALDRLNENNGSFGASDKTNDEQNRINSAKQATKQDEDIPAHKSIRTFILGMPDIENTQTYLRKVLTEKNVMEKNVFKQNPYQGNASKNKNSSISSYAKDDLERKEGIEVFDRNAWNTSVRDKVESEAKRKGVGDRTIRLKMGDNQDIDQGQSRPLDTINNVRPFIMDGRTMVPLRFIVESMGGQVQYDSNHQIIWITAEGKMISLRVGGSAAIVNGGVLYMDVPIQVKDNISYVPLQFVSEGLGLHVNMIAGMKEIEFTKTT